MKFIWEEQDIKPGRFLIRRYSMDLLSFINRSVELNSAPTEPVVLMDTTTAVVAAMLGIAESDVPREAETNAALEDLGDGVLRVWSGKRSEANGCAL